MMQPVLRAGGAMVCAIFWLATTGSALYDVPSPLPSAPPGTVIWSRPFTGGSLLKNAASNTLALYHTVSAAGRDVAVSGTIAIPKGSPPPGGWPVISWAHGTTGNAPQCAPSKAAVQNGEQRFLEQWISRGFAVVQTDYEGIGTPGVHPYFASGSGAHDVIDIVRAARHLNPDIGDRWIAMGHSEGGTVALYAAVTGRSWAPELHLLGVVAYAPGSDISDFFGETSVSTQPTTMLPLLGMMIAGIASTDPHVDLKTVLTPKGMALLPSLQSECDVALMSSAAWTSIPPADIFQPNARSSALMQDFIANEPLTWHLEGPVLVEQGTNDMVVPYQNSVVLRSVLCRNGSRLELDAVQGATHGSVMALSSDSVSAWISDRLAGKPASGNCPAS
ncbi:MAG TPA: lipase family protein [Candidatus Rubrimentiphilum sp.]|nr:lipase family protein [Candidatus Rubrimentiphilum sp.]